MKNIYKKIITAALGAAILVGSTSSVWAAESVAVHDVSETQTLDVEVGLDKSAEIPLKVDAEYDVFYNCSNIGPGDTMTATIIFRNDSNEDLQVAVTDVTNQLSDAKAIALLDILDLTVSVDGSPIYQGLHSNVTDPLTGWMDVGAGQTLDMDISVYMPKTADNTYQNSPMQVKWVFESRADEDEIVIDEPETIEPEIEENEIIHTGENSLRNLGILVLIIAAAAAAVGYSANRAKKAREKSNKED